MAKTSRDTSSARWPWLVGASALLLAVAWCAWDDEPPVVVPEPLAEPAVVVPEPPPPPPIALPPEPEPEPADAATELEVPPVDAGLVFREPNLEDYMNRWRAALAPLFEEKAVRYTKPTLIPAAPQPDAGVADAGVCERQEQRLSMLMNQRFDIVVAVDTSGSMNTSLEMVARWLAELELRIREQHSDTQLLVLADQRRLNRKRPDGGVNAMVQSNDALEVLLNFQWVRLLRPAAELRLVVITDDEADPYGPGAERFLSELTDRLEGRPFSFHVMGGFDTPPEVVLPPSAPVTPSLCSSGHEVGLAAGVTYQALARQTHGLRASLCHPGSRAALSAALLAVPSSQSCAWALDLARHRVDEVNAIGPDVARNRLTWERAPGLCRGMHWSYLVEGPVVSLCPETCAALRQDGYDAIDVTLECR